MKVKMKRATNHAVRHRADGAEAAVRAKPKSDQETAQKVAVGAAVQVDVVEKNLHPEAAARVVDGIAAVRRDVDAVAARVLALSGKEASDDDARTARIARRQREKRPGKARRRRSTRIERRKIANVVIATTRRKSHTRRRSAIEQRDKMALHSGRGSI